MRIKNDTSLQPNRWVAGIWCAMLCLSCVSTGPAREMSLMTETFPAADTVGEFTPTPDAAGVLAVRTATAGDQVLGYGVTERVKARSGPFIILVVVDTNLIVRRVAILSYPWERGRDVRLPAFTNQFQGKGSSDPLRLGKDIDAMTGATISSRAVTDGVRKVLRVVKEIHTR